MSLSSPNIIPSRGVCRIYPTLFILAVAALLALIVFPAAYPIGKKWEHERHYLDNYRPPNDYEAHLDNAMEYALGSSAANEVIFLGDSSCFCDVEPLLYEQITRRKAYNLGVVGVVGMKGFRLILDSYLKHHPKPKTIVLCLSPRNLSVPESMQGPVFERDRFLQFFGAESADFEPIAGNRALAAVKRGILVTFGKLTGGFQHYANEPYPLHAAENYNHQRANVLRERGYWEWSGVIEKKPRESINPQDPYPLAEPQKQQLINLARQMNDLNIKLMIRLTPVEPSATTENYHRVDEEFDEIKGQLPGATILQPTIIVYDYSLFGFIEHCNRRGAEIFTAYLANQIAIQEHE